MNSDQEARTGEPPGDSKDLLAHFMFCKMALIILPEARVFLIRVNLGEWEHTAETQLCKGERQGLTELSAFDLQT